MKRIPNLDPLRFLLASLVVFYHVPAVSATVGVPYWDALPLLHRGIPAVFVFFVLSGFLITFLLLKEKAKTGTVSIRKFYVRRLLRIWPVYYLVLVFGLVYYNVLLPAMGVAFTVEYDLWEAIALNVFFFPNVLGKWYDVGSILIVLWSIGIEEQFYLMWGPLSKYLPTRRFPVFLSGFAVVYAAIFWFSPLAPVLYKYQMFFYYFAVGGLFATVAVRQMVAFDGLLFRRPVQAVLTAAFVAYFTTDVFQSALPEWALHTLDAPLFAYVILNYGFNPNRLVTINADWANYLGEVSYGIYMYHMIALNFVLFLVLQGELADAFSPVALIVGVNVATYALTIAASIVSYEVYESYFLRLKDRFRTFRTAPSANASPSVSPAGGPVPGTAVDVGSGLSSPVSTSSQPSVSSSSPKRT
jgi:peptidoglycan/LPS O-acetylase OafA/YrhL